MSEEQNVVMKSHASDVLIFGAHVFITSTVHCLQISLYLYLFIENVIMNCLKLMRIKLFIFENLNRKYNIVNPINFEIQLSSLVFLSSVRTLKDVLKFTVFSYSRLIYLLVKLNNNVGG